MQISTGLAVIIVAVLIFYLRLIIIQRERVRQVRREAQSSTKKKGKARKPAPAPRFSIISQNKRDWIIAGAGILLIFLGVLLNLRSIPIPTAQTYWWLPVAVGIVAFSWGFK